MSLNCIRGRAKFYLLGLEALRILNQCKQYSTSNLLLQAFYLNIFNEAHFQIFAQSYNPCQLSFENISQGHLLSFSQSYASVSDTRHLSFSRRDFLWLTRMIFVQEG